VKPFFGPLGLATLSAKLADTKTDSEITTTKATSRVRMKISYCRSWRLLDGSILEAKSVPLRLCGQAHPDQVVGFFDCCGLFSAGRAFLT
jgi:hypothetical protein